MQSTRLTICTIFFIRRALASAGSVPSVSHEVEMTSDACSEPEQAAAHGSALLQTQKPQPPVSMLSATQLMQPVHGFQLYRESAPVAAQPAGMTMINPSGAAAPLTEAGYAAVADRCCQGEMREFIARVVINMGYEICSEGSLLGLAPFHSCEKGPQSLAKLDSDILRSLADPCTGFMLTGTCKPTPDTCIPPINPTTTDCGCHRGAAANLDFAASTLAQNNLDGTGPDTGTQEMRFRNIGTSQDGVALDLVITASSDYAVNHNNGAMNGYGGMGNKFGTFNIKATSPIAMSTFKFTFVKTNTDTEVTLGEIHFVLAIKGQAEEMASKGYMGYVTDVPTKLVAERLLDGRTKFTSPEKVALPNDPMAPSAEQKETQVMYFYTNVASFEMSFGSLAARNVRFAFVSALNERCDA